MSLFKNFTNVLSQVTSNQASQGFGKAAAMSALDGGISAGINLLGGFLSNQLNKNPQKEMMQYQNQLYRQNVVDMPGLQVQGYRNAGLSTASLAGNFSSNVAQPNATGQMTGFTGSQGSSLAQNMQNLANIQNTNANTKLLQNQADLVKSQQLGQDNINSRYNDTINSLLANQAADTLFKQTQNKGLEFDNQVKEVTASVYGDKSVYGEYLRQTLNNNLSEQAARIGLTNAQLDLTNKQFQQSDEYLALAYWNAKINQQNANSNSANASANLQNAATNAEHLKIDQQNADSNTIQAQAYQKSVANDTKVKDSHALLNNANAAAADAQAAYVAILTANAAKEGKWIDEKNKAIIDQMGAQAVQAYTQSFANGAKGVSDLTNAGRNMVSPLSFPSIKP